MTEMSKTEKRVRRVLNSSLNLNVREDELLRAERLDDLFGVDSLAIIEFLTALEREFHIRLDADEITQSVIRDLPRLSEYIDARLPAGRDVDRTAKEEANDR